jgi:hypothetical protein
MSSLALHAAWLRSRARPANTVHPDTPGALAIRVRRPGFADRLVTEPAPPDPSFGKPMHLCCDSPSGHGAPPLTFATREEAEAERRRWERFYAAGGYRFDLVERVMLPSWRAVGGQTR